MAKLKRQQHFEKWWKINHHRTNAHKWLVKNAKRVAHCFYLPPALHEDVHYISKRFNSSEWPRLSQAEAWTLWKVCHPTRASRQDGIIEKARELDDAVWALNNAKRKEEGKFEWKIVPLKLESQKK